MDEKRMQELWDKAGGDIYAYADLVAEEEREACAKICETLVLPMSGKVRQPLAKAIRAREKE